MSPRRIPELISIPTIEDSAGNIAVMEAQALLHFAVKRVFFIYGLQASSRRGVHAHHKLEEFLVASAGSFRVTLESIGGQMWQFDLSSPDEGVYVPPRHWCVVDNFSTDAICLSLCSREYSASDYVRNYDEFRLLGQTAR